MDTFRLGRDAVLKQIALATAATERKHYATALVHLAAIENAVAQMRWTLTQLRVDERRAQEAQGGHTG